MTRKPKEDNTARVQAVQDLRRSGASGTHADKRTKRVRTRQTKVEQAIKDQLGSD